ncbi:hypothetical protein TWF694_005850 [Orbilia ellipsospora]|uniref:CHAT domain-containing protein n=1 Tax=Orbilia ellipsospora TaxID=2528407 RepID=A0AAV9WTR1_9PEZI
MGPPNIDTETAVSLDSRNGQELDNFVSTLTKLSFTLEARFQQNGSMEDLNRAIEMTERAVEAIPQGNNKLIGCLNNLGILLKTRFLRAGSMDDLNRAIEITTRAFKITLQVPTHPHRAPCWNTLGGLLESRFQQTGLIADINGAIKLTDMAVNAAPQGHPDWISYLDNLGNQLVHRFNRTGSMRDLDRAIEVANRAVDFVMHTQNHPSQASCLNNLANSLGTRFQQTASIEDLNRAIEIANITVKTIPQDHKDRAACLNDYGCWLGTRFQRTGSMVDLNDAIKIIGMATEIMPQDYLARASRLSNLAILLGERSKRTGSIDDLTRAIKIADTAAKTTPQGHPSRTDYLANHGAWLGERFLRAGLMEDLDRAIELADMVLKITPQDHLNFAPSLNNLGWWLGIRSSYITSSIKDLDRAVGLMDQAIKITPQDHPSQLIYRHNLGKVLGDRFKRTGSLDDLTRAIGIVDVITKITPKDHPNLALHLNNLGDQFWARYQLTKSMGDLDNALSSYKKGWNCNNSPPSTRIHLGRQAALIFALQQNWEDSNSILEEAIKLLPTLSPMSLKHTDKQFMLAEFAGVASIAAAVSLNAGKGAHHALQLLELGRGIIANLLMETRGGVISELKQKHPALADEFISLRDLLDSLIDVMAGGLISMGGAASTAPQTHQRFELEQKFNKVITEIRAQPGFQSFLLQQIGTDIDWRYAASHGPVVIINISLFRCDAFLVEHQQIRLLELPNLTLEEVEKQVQGVQSCSGASVNTDAMLKWLWDTICCPVLDTLDLKDRISDGKNWPHVWWIPTGLLSQLPLHAAGYHEEGSTNTVLDRVMSSYTLSINTLIHARRNHTQDSTSPRPGVGHALLVAMKHTPDLPTNQILPFVEDLTKILKEFCLSFGLNSITPTPQKDEVLKHLRNCRIFHFAGHGSSHPTDPSQTYLLLNDWKTNPLTVGDIRDCKFQQDWSGGKTDQDPPFLSFLSACRTSTNEAEKLVDEGIHLVSAFQLAGFRHVIGTLWEVSDKHSADVARILYKTIQDEGLTDLAVCRGLHRAMRALRDERIEEDTEGQARNAKVLKIGDLENYHWIPYVHFGV